jgi:hypothetical protein
MNKRSRIILVSVALAMVLAVVFSAVAFAGNGYNGNGTGSCDATVSELLGLTPEQVCDLREEGKSLVQIATDNGVTEEQLVAKIMETKKADLDARVANGTLTQERADVMLQQMEKSTIQAVNRTTHGRPVDKGNGNCSGQTGEGTGFGQMRHYGASENGNTNRNQNEGACSSADSCTGSGMGSGAMGRRGASR